MSGVLQTMRKVHINKVLINRTLDVLQAFGSRRLEGLVLWLGNANEAGAEVLEVYVPDQHPVSSEDGLGYFVSGETLFQLNRILSSSGLRLIAQVHSHPTEAYHSETDDRFAIVTAEGGLSLVVPDFGHSEPDLSFWAIYRLCKGEWQEMSEDQVQATFSVEG